MNFFSLESQGFKKESSDEANAVYFSLRLYFPQHIQQSCDEDLNDYSTLVYSKFDEIYNEWDAKKEGGVEFTLCFDPSLEEDEVSKYTFLHVQFLYEGDKNAWAPEVRDSAVALSQNLAKRFEEKNFGLVLQHISCHIKTTCMMGTGNLYGPN